MNTNTQFDLSQMSDFVLLKDPTAGTVALWVLFLFGSFALYLLPAIIANLKKHTNYNALLLVNFLFGWIGVVWIICLVWAVWNQPQPQQPVQTLSPLGQVPVSTHTVMSTGAAPLYHEHIIKDERR